MQPREGELIVSKTKMVGVLLVNTGTPDAPKPRAVRKYLARFLSDPRICPMPKLAWWFILHLFILPKRGRASAKKYAKIWTDEGSPFTIAHQKLMRGLQSNYDEEGRPVIVRVAMNYSKPFVVDELAYLRDAGCEKIVVLPLYPQSALSTTGSVRDHVDQALEKLQWDIPCVVIDNYHDNPVYIRAIAASIKRAGFEVDSNDKLLFSYHSIPLVDIEKGDTYELQTGASSLLIANELGLDRVRWTIGYQCRFDKSRTWVSPYTKDVLKRLAEHDNARLFMVCPNFAVDCLETLYDIDYELKPQYFNDMLQAGRTIDEDSFHYVPCLDRSKAHVQVLSQVLAPYLSEE